MIFLSKEDGILKIRENGIKDFPDSQCFDFIECFHCVFAVRLHTKDDFWEIHIASPKRKRHLARHAVKCVCNILGNVKVHIESRKKNVINMAYKCGFKLKSVEILTNIYGISEEYHLMRRISQWGV